MVSAWRADTKDSLSADTINVFCSSADCSLFSCFSLFIVILFLFGNNPSCHLQDQPAFDKKQFVTFMKHYIKNLTAKLDVEQSDVFRNIEVATKYLLGRLKDLQL
jgi:hypothetical protein